MATTLSDWRPSPLAAARVPAALAKVTQVCVLGQPAVQIQVRTAPIFGHLLTEGATTKINNYIGTIAAAAAEGATTSVLHRTSSAVEVLKPRAQKVQGDMVKGGDARGIPPRGTPV